MVQSEPVPDFVYSRQTLLIVRSAGIGHGRCKADTSIENLIIAGRSRLGEVAETEEPTAEVRGEVEVEIGVGALMECRLH